jgi:hypothetical protein
MSGKESRSRKEPEWVEYAKAKVLHPLQSESLLCLDEVISTLPPVKQEKAVANRDSRGSGKETQANRSEGIPYDHQRR